MTAKNAEISRRILARIANGATVAQAVDAVLGAGTFDGLAGDIYEALRNKR